MGDFFDDFNEEEFDAEAAKNHRDEKNRMRSHPLFKQAQEIIEVVNSLVESIKDEGLKEMYGSTMTESAYIILAKLSGAITSDSYSLAMQNAAIIREHGEYLRVATSGLHMLDESHTEYIIVLRDEMEKFRMLFKNWIVEIKQLGDETDDEWGLFVK